MNSPTPRRLLDYVRRRLGLAWYLDHPGDGRKQPEIPARALAWALLLGQLLRETSYHALESLVRSTRRKDSGVATSFGDDALGYFSERVDPAVIRSAAALAIHRAKRNKAFDDCRWIGLAIDGTSVGRCHQTGCALCRPIRDHNKQIIGYRHQFAMVSVVGCGLTLPLDVEPYGPGDSEYAAAQRLLPRAVASLGVRFANYVVVDGGFSTAPFLHAVGAVGLHVVARLKDNLPELFAAAKKRFRGKPPTQIFWAGKDRVEIWDAGDFDPWETLRWETVRVIYYRQHKPHGEVVEAYWLTDFTARQASARSLFQMGKSRWEIENQGFNDAKTRYGIEHICHHHANSLLIEWLNAAFALTIERLYRIRYLHRGAHPRLSSEQFCLALWLNLGRQPAIHSG